MGLVHTEVTLKNAIDVGNYRRGIIKEEEIRRITVQAVVDTGSAMLVINETICRQLGLVIEDDYWGELADGSVQNYPLTEPVQVQWKDRRASCQAVVLPQASSVLLGAIPLEAMDLTVNPAKQEVTGAHGDKVIYLLCLYKESP